MQPEENRIYLYQDYRLHQAGSSPQEVKALLQDALDSVFVPKIEKFEGSIQRRKGGKFLVSFDYQTGLREYLCEINDLMQSFKKQGQGLEIQISHYLYEAGELTQQDMMQFKKMAPVLSKLEGVFATQKLAIPGLGFDEFLEPVPGIQVNRLKIIQKKAGGKSHFKLALKVLLALLIIPPCLILLLFFIPGVQEYYYERIYAPLFENLSGENHPMKLFSRLESLGERSQNQVLERFLTFYVKTELSRLKANRLSKADEECLSRMNQAKKFYPWSPSLNLALQFLDGLLIEDPGRYKALKQGCHSFPSGCQELKSFLFVLLERQNLDPYFLYEKLTSPEEVFQDMEMESLLLKMVRQSLKFPIKGRVKFYEQLLDKDDSLDLLKVFREAIASEEPIARRNGFQFLLEVGQLDPYSLHKYIVGQLGSEEQLVKDLQLLKNFPRVTDKQQTLIMLEKLEMDLKRKVSDELYHIILELHEVVSMKAK